jgi:putative phage-type endonuclease
MSKKNWLAVRRTGIGGSDVAGILGMSPWKSPMDVWMDKKGLVPERTDPDREFLLDLGVKLEPVIAGLYEDATGRKLIRPDAVRRHKEHLVLLANPDRLVNGELRGVELKSENIFSNQFGEPGTDEVPQHYALQCMHYMAVMDFPYWDIAVLHGGAQFSIYQLRRDAELESMMVKHLLAWWQKHIVDGVPPEVDSSDAWRVYLHQKYPLNIRPIAEIAPEKSELIDRLYRVRGMEKSVEALRAELENQLKDAIGDCDGVTSPYGRVTWKKTKDSEHIDWEGAFKALYANSSPPAQTIMREAIVRCTSTRPGVRRFLFTPRKDFYGIGPNEARTILESASALLSAGDGEHSVGGSSEGTDRSAIRDGGETPARPGPSAPETSEGVPPSGIRPSGEIPETSR